MTLEQLQSDEQLRREEFPVAKSKIFLGHAGVCPLPNRVNQAVRAYAQQCTQGDQETVRPALQSQHTRELAAKLIHAQPDEIAFVGPTSLALSFVAGGLPLGKNDNILVYLEDYPSNVYPWMAMADRGVEVRFINIRQLGRIRPMDVLGQVDESTRLVALASCHFIAGYRIDVNAIGAALRQRRILFCVDGIQTVGAFPTSVENVDFLAADAHKWMLGPCGAGILYVRKSVQELLRPIVFGWNNLRCPDFVTQEELNFRPGARRYEAGTHNLLGLVGLHAALELLDEIGPEAISRQLLAHRNFLLPQLQAKGYTVLHSDTPAENASAIVSFYRDGHDMSQLHARLDEAGVVASLRTDRSGRHYIRLSPHFYNTAAELARVVELL